jgi:threonine dehydratase
MAISLPSLEGIRAAAERIRPFAVRTPLVRFEVPGDDRRIYLKLENLQPTGAFKLRGAANAILSAPATEMGRGVYTASAGNMALGVAYCANKLGVSCTVVVPDRAPRIKIDALKRLGAQVVTVSFDEWWQTMVDHRFEGIDGFFVHPFEDAKVLEGNATMGLEIAEEIDDIDAVVVPWGGGGSATGIASAMRALGRRTRVVPVEVDTAMPLAASFAAGTAASIVPAPSFVDGMNGKSVFPSMWELARDVVERPCALSAAQIAGGVRMLAERAKIVAEGAGAAPLVAALEQMPDARTIVCLVSGGNIDADRLATILGGGIPS